MLHGLHARLLVVVEIRLRGELVIRFEDELLIVRFRLL